MAELRRHHRYTYAEYVALETVSAEKHEFFDGEIYVMAGGSEDHSALAAAMIAALHGAVRDLPCRVHTSDLRMFVESVGLATYPDASVICGPLQQHAASPNATAVNPSVLVEVTSDSSEEYDTGAKLEYYQTIPSLREYVIVSHRERRVTVYVRDSDGPWSRRDAIPGDAVAIPSLNAQLFVDDVYRNSAVV